MKRIILAGMLSFGAFWDVSRIERFRVELSAGLDNGVGNVVAVFPVTVVPGFTVNSGGLNVKFSILTVVSSA